jgi:hypothetical protein
MRTGRVPAAQVRLRGLKGLEGVLARRFLRVPDASCDFALAMGLPDATGSCGHASGSAISSQYGSPAFPVGPGPVERPSTVSVDTSPMVSVLVAQWGHLRRKRRFAAGP